MNEPLREMISAVVDGEATEFERRRVVDCVDDPEVRALMARHYAVRSVLRGQAHALCPSSLTANILAAVAAEAPAPAAVARWRLPVGGAAVAASVCMAAVFGVRALWPAPDAVAPAPMVATAGSATLGELGPAAGAASSRFARPAVVPVGFAPASHRPVGNVPQPADTGADRLAEQRLRLFMVDHVQNAALNTNQGMLPYARMVSVEAP